MIVAFSPAQSYSGRNEQPITTRIVLLTVFIKIINYR